MIHEVRIRAWREEDAPVMAPLADNPAVEANLRDGLPSPYTLQDAQDFIRFCLEAPAGQLYRVIEVDGAFAGSIGLFQKDNIYLKSAELGYWLGEPYWGKGVTTRAAHLICKEGFETLDILRIYAEPFAYNKGSRRVLEKLGFALEGTLRSNAIKHGKVIDSCVYGLLREEFNPSLFSL